MAANPALLDRTVEEFRRTLTEIGGQPSSADDAEVLGRRAAMVVLAAGAWERALGELLTGAEARVLPAPPDDLPELPSTKSNRVARINAEPVSLAR
jgi:hypothetical protein